MAAQSPSVSPANPACLAKQPKIGNIMRWLKRISVTVLVLLVLGAVGFFIFGPGIAEKMQNRVVSHDPWPVSTKAAALHKSLAIADWHADSLLWNRDLLKRGTYGHVDFLRLAEGNVAIRVSEAENKDAFSFQFAGIQGALDDFLIGTKSAALLHHGVDQCCFAMIDVRDDRDISELHQ